MKKCSLAIASVIAILPGVALAEATPRPGCFSDLLIEGKSGLQFVVQNAEERVIQIKASVPGTGLQGAVLKIEFGTKKELCSEAAQAENAPAPGPDTKGFSQVAASCVRTVAKEATPVFVTLTPAPQDKNQITVRVNCF